MITLGLQQSNYQARCFCSSNPTLEKAHNKLMKQLIDAFSSVSDDTIRVILSPKNEQQEQH